VRRRVRLQKRRITFHADGDGDDSAGIDDSASCGCGVVLRDQVEASRVWRCWAACATCHSLQECEQRKWLYDSLAVYSKRKNKKAGRNNSIRSDPCVVVPKKGGVKKAAVRLLHSCPDGLVLDCVRGLAYR
jgi:hypothetical protein